MMGLEKTIEDLWQEAGFGVSCVMPHIATDICDAQAVDFKGAQNHRKTYPLCNTTPFMGVRRRNQNANAESVWMRPPWARLKEANESILLH